MQKRRTYYSDFRRGLESEGLRPAYCFSGAEPFLKEQGVRAIVDKALPLEARSLNLEMVYAGSDVTGQETRERALTLPFLAERRVVVVRQADKWRATDLAALEPYLDDPAPSTVLVLVLLEERIKTEAWKRLAAKTVHVECYPLFDSQVPAWIEARAGDYSKRIGRDAVLRLIEQTGQGLSDLDHELAKLAAYVGGKDVITAPDVTEAGGRFREETLGDLTRALGARDGQRALELAGRILDEGVPGLQVLNAVVWFFRNLWAIRQRLDAGEPSEKVLAHLRSPQQRQETLLQVKQFAREDYERAFLELLRLDEQAKTGRTHWEMRLQLALLRICRRVRPGGTTAAAAVRT